MNSSEVLCLHSSHSSARFLELPWSYYQGAEYLFHVNPTDWDTYEFICGWLRSGMATINSSGEQAFIENKIKKVTKIIILTNNALPVFFTSYFQLHILESLIAYYFR